MKFKKIALYLIIPFFVSAFSSAATWYYLKQEPEAPPAWSEVLNLSPEQAVKFAALENEFKTLLNESAAADAKNKAALCACLSGAGPSPQDLDKSVKNMSRAYEEKQKKTAALLASISAILNPEQRKILSSKLLHEACLSCQGGADAGPCLCDACEHSGDKK